MEKLIRLFREHGPLTGKEILQKIDETDINIFKLWKNCNCCQGVCSKTIGEKYLRFDKHVEDYARLSPSIIREFSNYTVIGLDEQTEEIKIKAERIYEECIEISKRKFELAHDVIQKVVEAQMIPELVLAKVCFMIGGDVAYGMANSEARAEYSTGKMVSGSDLDIVVIYKDLPYSIVEGIDSSIYEQKAYLLKNPNYREEIDYIIKDIIKVKKQLEFDDLKSMIAAKVLFEGKYLYGSYEMFTEIKEMIAYKGIPEKISMLKEKAEEDRKNATIQLLKYEAPEYDEESMKLFYSTDEKNEFF